MINIVLSHSQQIANRCITGDTEQDHTTLIVNAIYQKLKDDDRIKAYVIPKLAGTDVENLKQAVLLSNDFIQKNGGTGYHLAIHTDGGYAGSGASGFYYSDSGAKFGRPIFDEICALTPWDDMTFRLRQGLYELHRTIATGFLLEVAFHDKPDQAKWIHENIDAIAAAIVRGIYKGIGLEPLDEMTIEEAMKFLSQKANIEYDTWLNNANSHKVAFLDLCFEKIAKAWKDDLYERKNS